DSASVFVHDPMHHRKSQTRPTWLRGEERIKNFVEDVFRNSIPRVAEHDLDRLSFSNNLRHPSRREGQDTAFRHGLTGILPQIPEHLTHLVGVHHGADALL